VVKYMKLILITQKVLEIVAEAETMVEVLAVIQKKNYSHPK
jgi:hypothetical protein